MRSIVVLLSFYGIATLLPILLIPVTSQLSAPFNQPLRSGDWLDLALTPWVGVGTFAILYILLPGAASRDVPSRNLFRILFFFFAVIYVEGHGMHLAADLINSQLLQSMTLELEQTVDFLDELLSHFLWYVGASGLAATTVLYQKKLPALKYLTRAQAAVLVAAGLGYGLGFSIFLIEGRSVWWAAPLFALLILLMVINTIREGSEWGTLPTWVFFLPGFLGILLGFLAWGIRFGGFPEPSTIFLF